MVPLFLHPTDPWFHLWYKPIIIISRNTHVISIHDFMFDVNIVIGIGSNSAVSTSKSTVIRKNRDENGGHTEFFGPHPHFSGSFFLVFIIFL